MYCNFLLLFLIGLALAKVDFLETKLGRNFRYQVADNVTKWQRRVPLQRHRGVQLIEACDDGDESAKCSHWSDKKGNVLTSTTKSHLFKNGTLIIYEVQEDDQGTYWIPGKTEFRTTNEEGTLVGWHNGFELDVWL